MDTTRNQEYQQQVEGIARKSHELKGVLVGSIVDESTGNIIADANVCSQRITAAVKNTVYESAGESAPMIAARHSKALQEYYRRYGHMPSDAALASAHQAIDNVLSLSRNKLDGVQGSVFESANFARDMSTTDGILMRDRMVSLILPAMLQAVTTNMVTFIPGQLNQSEIFRVQRVAGSTFGDITKGDVINHTFNGRYTVMDQRADVGVGDGTNKKFVLNTKTQFGIAYPLKVKSIRVLHDHDIVASDVATEGYLSGVFKIGDSAVTVSGAVDYVAGIVTADFSAPPAAGIKIHIGYDVAIEKDASLIPRIDHQMSSRTLYPHESAIAGDATLQALWMLRRELGLSIDNMTLAGMRNLLAADKDRKILRELEFFAKGVFQWGYIGSDALTLKEHYETLKAVLLDIDTELMLRTGVSGLVGLVGGTAAVNIFRYLPDPLFTPAPGYQSLPQPHYVGRLFNQWDLYCDPNRKAKFSCTCFARGVEHGQTAYVAGDAVPALTFRHPMLQELVNRATMWELAYRDLQPFDEREYLTTLEMVADPVTASVSNTVSEVAE